MCGGTYLVQKTSCLKCFVHRFEYGMKCCKDLHCPQVQSLRIFVSASCVIIHIIEVQCMSI